jgi:hypothetical protein
VRMRRDHEATQQEGGHLYAEESFFFGGVGFELRALCLPSRHSTV